MGWLLWFGQPPAAYCAEAGNLGGWGGGTGGVGSQILRRTWVWVSEEPCMLQYLIVSITVSSPRSRIHVCLSRQHAPQKCSNSWCITSLLRTTYETFWLATVLGFFCLGWFVLGGELKGGKKKGRESWCTDVLCCSHEGKWQHHPALK